MHNNTENESTIIDQSSNDIILEVVNSENNSDDDLLLVISRHIQNVQQSGNNYVHGFIDGKDQLDKFLAEYRIASGINFYVRDSHGWCKTKKINSFLTSKLLWSCNTSSIPVPSFNTPFIIEGYMVKDCIYGTKAPAKIKVPMINTKNENTQPSSKPSVKPQQRIRTSKKIGCKASIKMKEIKLFPDYEINPSDVSSAKGLRKLKNSKLDCLRKVFKNKDNVTVISRFCIEVPLHNAHSHAVSNSSEPLFNRIDPAITRKITQLVYEGCTNAKEIKTHLDNYVMHDLFQNLPIVPEKNDRSFYPFERDIKNHIRLALKKQSIIQEQQRVIITELQNIANIACSCMDSTKLEFVLNKIEDIRNGLLADYVIVDDINDDLTTVQMEINDSSGDNSYNVENNSNVEVNAGVVEQIESSIETTTEILETNINTCVDEQSIHEI